MSIYSGGVLLLFGDVGDGFTAGMVREALAEHGPRPVQAYLFSEGGSPAEGAQIIESLLLHRAGARIVVYVCAEGAASLIAMAASDVCMITDAYLSVGDVGAPASSAEELAWGLIAMKLRRPTEQARELLAARGKIGAREAQSLGLATSVFTAAPDFIHAWERPLPSTSDLKERMH